MGGKVRIGAVAVLCFSWFLVASSANYTNILRQGALLRFGEQLVSSNQLFSLGIGFLYGVADYGSIVRINWYDRNENVSTGTWPPLLVGNTYYPIPDGSPGLPLGSNGELKITMDGVRGNYTIILSEGEANSLNASAILHDNGNFVIHELNSDGSVEKEEKERRMEREREKIYTSLCSTRWMVQRQQYREGAKELDK